MKRNLIGFPKLLPVTTLMETVRTAEPIVRQSPIARAVCYHLRIVSYVRIDHEAGPGSFADNYEGLVCVNCGAIHSERRSN